VVVLTLLAIMFSSSRSRVRATTSRPLPLSRGPLGMAAGAGLALALRADAGRGRGRGWRSVAATVAASATLGVTAVFVASAVALTSTPSRYGLDADLVAINAYGDQSDAALARAFARRSDVIAATGFTSSAYLVDDHAVPGLAMTTVKGELAPTNLAGRPPRSQHEVALGRDTADAVGVDLGDTVHVQVVNATGPSANPARDPLPLRVVGIMTFPAVDQLGSDTARLGTGALVTRGAYLAMGGDPKNDPEFSVVRVADGADPHTVIDANRAGFHDASQSTTSWFTDAKPAELLQLDAAMPYLRASLLIAFAILVGVVVHALWSLVRANGHDLAVLRSIGCTRRQLDAVAAWQGAPFALGALLVGVPMGIALGRFSYRWFARSIAVVDTQTTTALLVVSLVAVVVVALAVADVIGIMTARRTRTAELLREA